MPRKSWKEKLLDNKGLPKFIEFHTKLPCAKALIKMGAKPGDKVVLAPPIDVYNVMKEVPEGKLIDLNGICRILAEKYNADYCCTLTTGIFTWIAANAAVEMGEEIPYWRTVKNKGVLNDKYPGGAEKQKELLEKEGFKVVKKGKRYVVSNFEDYLMCARR